MRRVYCANTDQKKAGVSTWILEKPTSERVSWKTLSNDEVTVKCTMKVEVLQQFLIVLNILPGFLLLTPYAKVDPLVKTARYYYVKNAVIS